MKHLLVLFVFFPAIALAMFGFADVPNTHPYAQAINYLEDQNIVDGYGDGTFKPAQAINRAEFTKIITESQFNNSAIFACTGQIFGDVKSSDWFYPYVCLAHQQGLIEGYPDGSFRPGDQILLGEAAKIMVESFDLNINRNLTPWYEPYLQRLRDDQAIPASVGGADHALNRGEMAELIYRLMINTANTPEPEIVTQRGTESIGSANFDDDQIQTILELTNQARLDNGVTTLSLNTQLNQIAQDYAQRMDEEDFFDHIDPEGKGPGKRVSEAGYKWRFIGENIAKGQVSAEYAFENWKGSSGHWANILNPNYKEIGIGQVKVTNDPRFRGYFWVQIFATKP